jgi:hypothetical protein
VPNRPGVIAQLALELGRAGVNITDMALYPGADMSEGVVALWIAGEERRRAAQDLVASSGSRWRGMSVRMNPASSHPVRCAGGSAARGQVDLAPGGADRRDGVRAGPDPQLPRRRRHQLDARGGARPRRDRRGPGRRAADPRRRAAQRAGAGQVRSTSGTPGR